MDLNHGVDVSVYEPRTDVHARGGDLETLRGQFNRPGFAVAAEVVFELDQCIGFSDARINDS